MKKLVAVFAVFAMILATACGGGKKSDNPLVGEWEFDKLEIAKIEETPAPTGDSATDSLTKGLNDMASGLTKGLDAMAGAFLKGAIYEFMDGGKCKITVMGMSAEGTYTQSEDKKSLTMVNSGKEEKHSIVKNTPEELVLQAEDGSTMYFKAKK